VTAVHAAIGHRVVAGDVRDPLPALAAREQRLAARRFTGP
jgi:hypothetical protein